MRVSTFFFLALFGAFVLHDRVRCDFGRRLRLACESSSCAATIDAASSARVRELEGELSRLERRGRDLERSLQAVSQSARALRELADRHGDAAVRGELVEIEAGRDRLKELRDRAEMDKVAVAARLQLARAGLETDLELERDDRRQSPVDALSTVEVGRSARVTSRAR